MFDAPVHQAGAFFVRGWQDLPPLVRPGKEVMPSSQYVVFVRPVTAPVDSGRSPRIGEGASDALISR